MNRSLLLAFTVVAAILLTSALAQVSPIRMRVEQVSKGDKTSYKTVQSRSLTIHLTNSSQQPADVVVKWAVLGKDISSKEVVTVEQGEMKSSLKASGSEKLQTATAQAASEEARLGSKGKTEDIGTKITGHGVQVWQGDKMIAEMYEPASLKANFGKAPAAKPLDQQKKK